MILYIALPITPVTPITNNVILRTLHVPPKLANTKIAIIISIPTIEPTCLFWKHIYPSLSYSFL